MYKASKDRYDKMVYNRVGKSGLKIPALSLACGITLEVSIHLKTKRRLFIKPLIWESPTSI